MALISSQRSVSLRYAMDHEADSDAKAPQEVVRRSGQAFAGHVEVEGTSPHAILAVVTESSREQRRSMTVAVDASVTNAGLLDTDALTALCSVLVDLGVGAIRTSHPRVAERVYAMEAAIKAGALEVLQ